MTCPQKSAENAAEKQRFDPENNDSKQRFAAETTIQNNDSTKNNDSIFCESLFLGNLTPLNSENNDSIFCESLFLGNLTPLNSENNDSTKNNDSQKIESLFLRRIVVYESLFFMAESLFGRIVVSGNYRGQIAPKQRFDFL